MSYYPPHPFLYSKCQNNAGSKLKVPKSGGQGLSPMAQSTGGVAVGGHGLTPISEREEGLHKKGEKDYNTLCLFFLPCYCIKYKVTSTSGLAGQRDLQDLQKM